MATTARLQSRENSIVVDGPGVATARPGDLPFDETTPQPKKKQERGSPPGDRSVSGSKVDIGQGVVTVMLDERVPPSGVSAIDYCVTLNDGRTLPSWLGRPSFNILQGCLPGDQQALDLRVRGLLPNGASIVREIRIDLVAGRIERLPSGLGARHAPLFGEQVRKFAYISAIGANAIAAALDAVAIRAK